MLPILENGRKTIKRKCMANTNLNRQVIDIRTSSGVGDISNEVLRRWTDKGYDMAVKEGNYDRSREHLNFEIVKISQDRSINVWQKCLPHVASKTRTSGVRTPMSVLLCSLSSAAPMTA